MLLPVLNEADSESPILWRENQPIARREFARQLRQLATKLPPTRYAVNLCQDRFLFLLGFAAGCLRDQTQLLPANQTEGVLHALVTAYPDHCVLDDSEITCMLADDTASASDDGLEALVCPGEHIAAIAFTSGSTGEPQAHPCSWTMLSGAAERTRQGIFDYRTGNRCLSIVATVPPQHMFGLEVTVLQPLLGRCAVEASRPFFPADVAAALRSVPAPRALISTPTHLRALAASSANFAALEFTLSATAPMPIELAEIIEKQWGAPVLEIYGSTETGAIASRRTTQAPAWKILPGGDLSIHAADGKPRFTAAGLPCAIALHDQLELLGERRFHLAGRSGDLIKVAGKRASLAELNGRLLAIAGVRDGVMIQPAPDGRIAALVVAELGEQQILAALAHHIDEVFLPRPLRLVGSLPRDTLGKLPRKAILAALGLAVTAADE